MKEKATQEHSQTQKIMRSGTCINRALGLFVNIAYMAFSIGLVLAFVIAAREGNWIPLGIAAVFVACITLYALFMWLFGDWISRVVGRIKNIVTTVLVFVRNLYDKVLDRCLVQPFMRDFAQRTGLDPSFLQQPQTRATIAALPRETWERVLEYHSALRANISNLTTNLTAIAVILGMVVFYLFLLLPLPLPYALYGVLVCLILLLVAVLTYFRLRSLLRESFRNLADAQEWLETGSKWLSPNQVQAAEDARAEMEEKIARAKSEYEEYLARLVVLKSGDETRDVAIVAQIHEELDRLRNERIADDARAEHKGRRWELKKDLAVAMSFFVLGLAADRVQAITEIIDRLFEAISSAL